MKKTRIFAVLAAMAMGLAVFGCSNGDSDSSESGSTGGSASGGGTPGGSASGSDSESDTTGGTTSGNGTESGSTGGSTSGGGTESGSTGGSTSGSIEPVAENFVKIPAASISGTETWTPESEVFISGRKLEIASFQMSDHEVTRGEYKTVMGSDPSYGRAYDKNGNKLTSDDAVKNNPVHNVSWYDALVYCNTLSIKEGLTPCYAIGGSIKPDDWGSVPTSWNATWNAATCDFTADGYRLPTEAEWEWAARGGESYTYAGSSTIGDVAWYEDNAAGGTRDVKTKKANGYGLYDMSGNVWEWCWDYMYDNIRHGITVGEITSAGPASGYIRCRRGGSCSGVAKWAQVAIRGCGYPDEDNNLHYGFRLVRNAN